MSTVTGILLLGAFFSMQLSHAQTLVSSDSSADSQGEIRVITQPGIDEMVEEHVELNKSEAVLAGYRIQLISSPVMSKVKSAQAVFMSRFPAYSTHVVHESPNFKLRVGGFSDRFKAYQALQELIPDYSGAFIVKDLVKVSEL